MQEYQANDTISNRYRVIRKLGAGAMGSVYLCEDSVENNIKVAVKILVADGLEDQDIWAKGEYEALTRLRHPNLARVYNFGRIRDTKDYFIASEFIKGIDLFSATEYLNYDELADIVVQICRALEYIHSQGYVHFDIKPDNILVTRYKTVGIREGSKAQYSESDLASSKQAIYAKPKVKVIDFGLAEKMTGSFNFAIKGTLNYLAPEILNGQTPDRRADLYSLGVTLYQITNRELPFYQDYGSLDGAVAQRRSDLFGMHMKRHPEFLKTLILKLIEERPEDRFQSAREIIQFINKNSQYQFELETEETKASYFYSPKLVGRRKELNVLKEHYERVFFSNPSPGAPLQDEPRKSAPPQDGADSDVSEDLRLVADLAAEAEGGSHEVAAGPPACGADPVACPALILVSGEMGSGKSRLLEEYQHFLKLNDVWLVSGNCYEASSKAYQPFVELLKHLAFSFGLKSDLFERHKPAFLKLLPELSTPGDEAGREGGSRLDKEKLYFTERIAQLFVDAAEKRPYAVVFNNLHWVDEASVDLLEGVLTKIGELRAQGKCLKLQVIASIRYEDLILESARAMIENLRKVGLCREINIRRLKQTQIKELLSSMLSFADVPDEFVSTLEQKTAGNPLFIMETLKALQEDGVLKNSGSGWMVRTSNYDRIEIPQRMEDLLESRLRRLSKEKGELLDALSVLDKPASPLLLQKIARFERLAIIPELRGLEEGGIITKTIEGGRAHFLFSQPKIREIVYARIPEESRRVYHGEIAQALEEYYRGKEGEILEELAFHYRNSDLVEKAVEMANKAGDRLKAIYANEQAQEHYSFVLKKIEGDPARFHLWAAVEEKLGDLCTTMGRYDLAEQSYAALLDRGNLRSLDPHKVVKLFLARGRVHEIQGDYEYALKCFKDARNYLGSFKRNELVIDRIRVFNSIGWAYVCTGKYEKAMLISLEALRVIEGMPERIEHAMLYNTLGNANFFKGNIREAIEYHRRSLQIKEQLETVHDTIVSLNSLGSAHMAGAEYAEALELFGRALTTSVEIGDTYGKAVSLHNLAKLYFSVGDSERGWSSLDESLDLSRQYNMRYLNVQNYLLRGRAFLDQGESRKSESNLFRVLSSCTKRGNRMELCTVLLELADLHRKTGNLTSARKSVEEARALAWDVGIHALQARCLVEDACLLRENGSGGIEQSLKLLADAMTHAEKNGHPELQGKVLYEVAEGLVRLRRLAEARQTYAAAEEKFSEVLESLPVEFQDCYSTLLRRRFPCWKGTPAAPEAAPSSQDTSASGSSGGQGATISAEESLRRVNDLMVLLCSGVPLQEFLGRMLDEILSVWQAQSAVLLRVHGLDVDIDAARARGARPLPTPESCVSLKLVAGVLTSQAPLILGDVADDPSVLQLLEEESIVSSSLAVIPFPTGEGQRHVLYVTNPRLQRGGGGRDLWTIQPFLNLVPLARVQLASSHVVV